MTKRKQKHHLFTDEDGDTVCEVCAEVLREAEERGAKAERKKMLDGTWASDLREKLWKGKSPKEILESDPIKEAEQRGYSKGKEDGRKLFEGIAKTQYQEGFQKGIDAVEEELKKAPYHADDLGQLFLWSDNIDEAIETARKSTAQNEGNIQEKEDSPRRANRAERKEGKK